MKTRCVIIDTETTGLIPHKHGIVSLSILVVDFSDGDSESPFDVMAVGKWEVNPGAVEYTETAQAINKMSEEQIKGFQPSSEVIPDVDRFIKHFDRNGVLYIAHNAQFDYSMLVAGGYIPEDFRDSRTFACSKEFSKHWMECGGTHNSNHLSDLVDHYGVRGYIKDVCELLNSNGVEALENKNPNSIFSTHESSGIEYAGNAWRLNTMNDSHDALFDTVAVAFVLSLRCGWVPNVD